MSPPRGADLRRRCAALGVGLAALLCPVHARASGSTLHRVPDAVVVAAAKLGDVAGRDLDRYALVALTDPHTLTPIPFQLDEKTADGTSFVYPGGKEKNPDQGNERFDGFDELVFMASDCGARRPLPSVVGEPLQIAPMDPGAVPPWPEGTERVAELEVTDPTDGTVGYAYLLGFADSAADPPRSTRRYVDYRPDTETVVASSYTMGYEPGKDRIFFSRLSVPESAGGNGKNFVDRLKMRTQVDTKLFFSVRFDEDEWDSTVAAYLDGPVRAIREVKNRLAFVGIPVAPTILVEATYYRDFHVAPTAVHQTVNFPSIADAAWFNAEIDFSDEAKGMRYYRPSPGAPSPFHAIDGATTADEQSLDRRQPPWHLVSGAPGTFLWLMELPKPLEPATDLTFHDDAATPEPPESSPGTIGEIGYHMDLMPLPQGDYQMRVFYLFPPRWTPGVEKSWLEMTTAPLGVQVRSLGVSAGGAPS